MVAPPNNSCEIGEGSMRLGNICKATHMLRNGSAESRPQPVLSMSKMDYGCLREFALPVKPLEPIETTGTRQRSICFWEPCACLMILCTTCLHSLGVYLERKCESNLGITAD